MEPQNKKILPRAAVIQDMSGFGKVSLTEAIPVMSGMGIEVCPIPTAILSTHTYEFKNYTLCDLTDEMVKIISHWDEIGLEFDAVFSGYMSSERQVEITRDFMLKQRKCGAKIIVDPVMGDNALLDVQTVYSERMRELIGGMKELSAIADAITPNLTEACILTGQEYPKAPMNDEQIVMMLQRICDIGAPNVAVTGVMDGEKSMCVAVYDGDRYYKIDCGYIERPFHGTGDIFTTVFTGGLMQGNTIIEAASLGADFVYESIRKTVEYPQSIPIRQGVLFEPVLQEGYFSKDSHPNRITVIKG